MRIIPGISRFARNDMSLANAILMHIVPKNLVYGMKTLSFQRTRCFTSLAMTVKGEPTARPYQYRKQAKKVVDKME